MWSIWRERNPDTFQGSVMHDTIYYLIIGIYYFWYFYVKNVILGLGYLFPCF